MTPPEYPAFTGFEPCATTDPEAFFPEKGKAGVIVPAVLRRMCEDYCFMLDDCREWAVWHADEGFWGGTTPLQRRAIRKERGIRRVNESRQQAA